ncbi:hypothetical protein PPACK8108_LOCUS12239 [Phakopsora pachyrhizi]|uniref:Uncharacterized protein n=1 Tax=Phakopsora pachyrhizi TaxID=170000 RepID=A0AAV0B1M9_PHAPC|nr:hypothetical protein PPACK8108_LOCUS12239 [Phakopsora pachyrhizi]
MTQIHVPMASTSTGQNSPPSSYFIKHVGMDDGLGRLNSPYVAQHQTNNAKQWPSSLKIPTWRNDLIPGHDRLQMEMIIQKGNGIRINWSSDLSHLQQTFQLSSNPLRMHNSSSSSSSSSSSTSAYSSIESWSFDPSLIIPDGPLTLLQSDNKSKTEDSSVSSSIQSALFSSNVLANQVSHLVNRAKSSEIIFRPRTDDSEHDLHQLGCFESDYETEDEDWETTWFLE